MKKWLMANKVVIAAAFMGAFTAIYGLLIKPDFDITKDWLALAWAAFIATVGIIGNKLRGQAASLTTMIGTSGLNVAILQMPEGPNKYVLAGFQAIAVLGAVFWSSPPKPVEYEQTASMVTAKAEAKAIKVEAKDAAIKEEIKDLKKELEPPPAKIDAAKTARDAGTN